MPQTIQAQPPVSTGFNSAARYLIYLSWVGWLIILIFMILVRFSAGAGIAALYFFVIFFLASAVFTVILSLNRTSPQDQIFNGFIFFAPYFLFNVINAVAAPAGSAVSLQWYLFIPALPLAVGLIRKISETKNK